MKQSTFVWIGIAGLLLAVIATVAQEVQRQEEHLLELEQAIQRDEAAIRVLEAEWSYLNDPATLQHLAADHLDLVPLAGERLVAIEDLPYRLPEPTGVARPYRDLLVSSQIGRGQGLPSGFTTTLDAPSRPPRPSGPAVAARPASPPAGSADLAALIRRVAP